MEQQLETDLHERRLRLERNGRDLAEDLGIDIAAFGVGSNLHWAATLMKLQFERGPLRSLGLSLTDFVTLWTLRVGGTMETGEVAREAGLPNSSFSAVAKRLEQRGLVERRRQPDDGRLVLLTCSEEGAALAARAFAKVNVEATRMTSHLAAAQIEVLADLLRSVADRLEDLTTETGPTAPHE